MTWPYDEAEYEQDTATVFRSDVDPSVWMCNIPLLDVAAGIQASRSLPAIKKYVEETVKEDGMWAKLSKNSWEFRW